MAQVGGVAQPYVKLLPNVPVTAQAGNVYVSGSMLSSYVGVGRTTRLAVTELLGIKGLSSGFNGMNIEGPGGSKVYYGYATAGAIDAYTEWDDALGTLSLVAKGQYLTWTGSNLGVGTKSPNAQLDVRNGLFAVTDSGGSRKVEAFVGNDSGAGHVETMGPAGHTTNFFGTSGASDNYGYVGVCDNTGTTQALMYLDNLGKGHVVADVKNFRVPNPRNEAEDIYYASLEGPEAGAYVRGTGRLVNGKAHITLPEHFQDVTVSEGETVQVTPNSELSEGLAVKNKSNKGFDVVELRGAKGNYEFDWEVKCVRAGHEDYKVVRPWVNALPGGADQKKMWAARMESIALQKARTAQRVSRP